MRAQTNRILIGSAVGALTLLVIAISTSLCITSSLERIVANLQNAGVPVHYHALDSNQYPGGFCIAKTTTYLPFRVFLPSDHISRFLVAGFPKHRLYLHNILAGELISISKCAEIDIHCTDISDIDFDKSAATRVIFFSAYDTTVSDRTMALLSGSNTLHTLFIDNTNISVTGIRSLGELPALKELSVSKCNIGDESAEMFLRWSSLTYLNVSHTRISTVMIGRLSCLTKLRVLHCEGIMLDDNTIQRLLAMKSLERLFLSEGTITSGGLEMLQRHCHLKTITVGSNEIMLTP